MKFRTKLYLGFGTILALLLLFSFIVFQQLSVMNRNMHGVVEDNYVAVKLANRINAEINNLSIEMNESLLDQDKSLLPGRLESIESFKIALNSKMADLDLMASEQPELKQKIGTIDALYHAYVRHIDTAIELLKDGQKEQAVQLHNDETEKIRIDLFQTVVDLRKQQESGMEDSLRHSSSTYQITVRFMMILVGFTVLAGIAIAAGVFRSLTSSLELIVSAMKRAGRSDRTDLPRIYIKTKDELGSITEAFNQMAAELEASANQEQEHNRSLQQLSWHKSKIAEITTLYQSIQDLDSLANLFITSAAAALEARYGVFYLKQENESGAPRLVKIASYAGNREDIGAHGFALGDGLVGQCALENKKIIVNDPPKDYVKVRSGIGSATPVQIVISPVQFEKDVIAVVELAAIHPFTDGQLSLLDELIVTLGITIKSISGHMQVQKLLKEAQLFAEELQTQSEELQLQQEELKTLNEQLEEQFKNSNRKSMELEKTKDELEEKNRQIMLASGYKSEFLANMSHELRTPLNSLLILSQMLSENKEGNLTSKQMEFVRTIYSSGSDLLKLINEVLDLSKIESGTVEIVDDAVRLQDIADMAERHFSAVAAKKAIAFDVGLDDTLKYMDIHIHTDMQKLQQIVKNLLSNAFKFTEQGRVSLQFRYASGSEVQTYPILSAEEIVLAIEISDTGIGIPKVKQEIIFDAFQQADGTTNRKYGGTGLGLSISQKFVGLLGGVIGVDSEEGRGSTFTIYLPFGGAYAGMQNIYEREAAATIAEGFASGVYPFIADGQSTPDYEDKGKMQLSGKKILLVDDDMRNIYALTTVLESYDINVVFAENGQEGIHQLGDHPDTDLVLMDIMMPKMDGYEAIKEIRKQQRFGGLPIIALTAKAMKHDREKCVEAGASDYISKPVNVEQLISLIQVWLHR
ncbi:response regulator [Cohnella terricola]|uniref:Circadian input-output histidine kinase CikA n=1 Tax=Cohnella terricola TaxID=1289167 RepID=A0A559JGN0_9BACL|nr:response regulator [Cohnella terricola]TVX99025.1 response regulator [Cohnella terricola]